MFSSLNRQQEAAVKEINGPVLVLSGAGTGKTKTLVHRICNIVENDHAKIDEILAVTFTNKAAKEILNRVMSSNKLYGEYAGGSDKIWIGTFHSLSLRILRQHFELVGLESFFTIIDQDDQKKIITALVKNKYPESKNNILLFIKNINSIKEMAIELESVDDISKELFYLYNHRIRANNLIDFADIVSLNVRLFNDFPNIKEHYMNKFKYCMVDEYQDINTVQYFWIKHLSENHKNIFCVGDDDQSIYAWRGARIDKILNFKSDFPDAKVLKLEQNYRSTNNIILLANSLIIKNKFRFDKAIWSDNNIDKKIKVVSFNNSDMEAKYITYAAKRFLIANNGKSAAILVRTTAQMVSLEKFCISNKVSYRITGSIKFYTRLEIKQALCFLRLIVNIGDNISFANAINIPKRGLGKKTIDCVENEARDAGLSIVEFLVRNPEHKLSQKIKGFLDVLIGYNSTFKVSNYKNSNFIEGALKDFGYIHYLTESGEKDRLNNIQELISISNNYSSISDFIEGLSLGNSIDQDIQDNNYVSIMTFHAAKGLEFDSVFLPGWENGLFPSRKAIDNNSLEEERRLAYVAITRSKGDLMISYVKYRHIHGKFIYSDYSQFLNDLDHDLIVQYLGNNYCEIFPKINYNTYV